MTPRHWIILGCLTGASFFVGCQQQAPVDAVEKEAKAEPEMYEASELADLMREMYEGNLAVGRQLEAGEIPESFPEDFYTIHTAVATPGMKHDTAYFNAMAKEYLRNMDRITAAATPREAKIAYNDMILTCASCHQVYCQGPLAKIRRMQLTLDEPPAGKN